MSGFDVVRVFLVLYSHIAVTSVGSVQLITELTHVVFLVLWSMKKILPFGALCMAQPGGSNSSDGRSAYKEQRKHDYRGWTSFWSTFTNAWLHFITLTTHITWFVSVFWDDCSVSSTLRCRLILKFLSRWASFCCTSRWWNDSLGNKVLDDSA